jgi:hypothetical protein
MDPDAAAAPPLALAHAVPPAGPKILQLSPVPGNINNMDCFFYDPTANISQGDFGAVLAFASLYGHPVVIHECPSPYKFLAAHPSAIICPLLEVPLAISAWGSCLLSEAGNLAPAAIDQPPPVIDPPLPMAPLTGDQRFVIHTAPLTSVEARRLSDASNSLITHRLACLTHCGMDPPSLGIPSWAGLSAPVGALPAFVALVRPPPTILHGHLSCMPPQSGPPCPDPDGLDELPSPMGGCQFWGYGGSPSFFGGHPRFHGGSQSQHFSFSSSDLTADHWHNYNFPGGIPLVVPSVIHSGINPSPPHPSHGGSLHAPASVASPLTSAAPPLRPLMHEDLSASLALDLTMSFWPSSLVAVAPLVVPSVIVAPPLTPNLNANVALPPALNPDVSLPSPV